MIKRLFLFFLSAVLMMQIVPTTAFAANEATASSKVSYTYNKTNYYEIDIPETIDLDSTLSHKIYADNVVLDENKVLQISVDSSKLSNDDAFTLSLSTNMAKQMRCIVYGFDARVGVEKMNIKECSRCLQALLSLDGVWRCSILPGGRPTFFGVLPFPLTAFSPYGFPQFFVLT